MVWLLNGVPDPGQANIARWPKCWFWLPGPAGDSARCHARERNAGLLR
jgi:hypothetical protein